jgi:hypothetical protein
VNQQLPEPTEEQLKSARALGYASVVRRGLANSSVEGVKTATEGLASRAGALVNNYKERLTKRASRLQAVYAAIVEPEKA